METKKPDLTTIIENKNIEQKDAIKDANYMKNLLNSKKTDKVNKWWDNEKDIIFTKIEKAILEQESNCIYLDYIIDKDLRSKLFKEMFELNYSISNTSPINNIGIDAPKIKISW